MWVLATFKAGWTFFINGERVESLDSSLPPGGYGDKQATLGAFRLSNSISRFLTGQISQVRVWNRQRTGAEIRGTMYTLLSGAEPGLAAFWGLDTGSGAALPDLSGWNNVGEWLGGEEPPWILSTAPVGVRGAGAAEHARRHRPSGEHEERLCRLRRVNMARSTRMRAVALFQPDADAGAGRLRRRRNGAAGGFQDRRPRPPVRRPGPGRSHPDRLYRRRAAAAGGKPQALSRRSPVLHRRLDHLCR